jgi:translocator protein
MTLKPLRIQVGGLVAWLAVTYLAAAIGSAASVGAGVFYQSLDQPPWSPAPGVFGPVWSVLYTLMGIAAWWTWRAGGFTAARNALALYLAQLALNALWSWAFFAWHLGALAFVNILVLWLLIIATLVAFWRIRPLAGILLVPYLLWVSFAAALNLALWQRNPGLLGA